MLLRPLFHHGSSTWSYLLADESTREAVLVDPVFEQHVRDAALVRELGLELLYTLDTHCHADHVTGAWLRKVALGSLALVSCEHKAKNVDRSLAHGDVVSFGGQSLEVRATPGHTDGCVSLVTADNWFIAHFASEASGGVSVMTYAKQLFTAPMAVLAQAAE